MKPKIPLTDWQRGFIEDEGQFRWLAAARQSGKSHGLAADSILPSVERPRNLEILLSRGERQSVELIGKVKQQCQALGVASELLEGFFKDTSLLQQTIVFPNGSRIIGLPANPDTARGYSGNVKLDEFGLHKDSREIWAALAPSATRGFRIAMASTFKGTENKFYEIGKLLGLHTGERPENQPVRRGVWSGHWVDVYMSAEQTMRTLGIRIDVESLREAIGDEEVWAQEFLNVPMAGAENYIPLDLVLACESSEASLEWGGKSEPGLCAGFDVARKRDLSVIVIGVPLADLVVVRGVIWMVAMKFADQAKVAREVAAAVAEGGGRFAVDATGLGAQLAEELHEEFPCVEPVEFGSRIESGGKTEDDKVVTVPVKERMAVELKRRFEERTLRLPESTKLRRAIQAIKRYVGPTGAVRFDAVRTDRGHADEFWALALMVSAAAGPRRQIQSMAEFSGIGGMPVLHNFMEHTF